MALVRTYLLTDPLTEGVQGSRSLVRIDASRVALDWRRSDGKLITRQLLSNTELAALGAAATAFPPAPAPVPAPVPAPTLAAPVLRGTAGDGLIDLSWTLASGTPKFFEVWINDRWVTQVAAGDRSWRKTGLPNGTALVVRVVVYDGVGYRNSNNVSLTPTAAGAVVVSEPPPPIVSRYNTPVLDEDWLHGIDPQRWSIYTTPGDHADEPGVRAASAWTTANGLLVCTARNQADGQIVTGGMSHRMDLRGGRWEFRIRTDADPTQSLSGVGLLWPQKDGDRFASRAEGEFDVYETERGLTRRPFRSFLHFGYPQDLQQGWTHDADASEWHTMTVDWEPDAPRMRVFRDDILVATITDPARMPRRGEHLAFQLDAFERRALLAPVRMEVGRVRVLQ